MKNNGLEGLVSRLTGYSCGRSMFSTHILPEKKMLVTPVPGYPMTCCVLQILCTHNTHTCIFFLYVVCIENCIKDGFLSRQGRRGREYGRGGGRGGEGEGKAQVGQQLGVFRRLTVIT